MQMTKLLPANRVAAIATWLVAAGALTTEVTGTLPHSWQATAVVVAALATKASVAIKFMQGSQVIDAHANDALLYGPAPAVAAAPIVDPAEQTNDLAVYAPDYAGAPDPDPTEFVG